MSTCTAHSIFKLPRLPPELVEEILLYVGVDACAALRNLRALRRLLAGYVRTGNYSNDCEQAALKVLVDRHWSEGVQAMIDANIRYPFCRGQELDWSGIVLPVSSIQKTYLWYCASSGWPDARELVSILTYNRIKAGADCTDLLQWGVRQVPDFVSELSRQYIKHGRSLAQLRALHQELGVYLHDRHLAKTLLLFAAHHGRLDLVQELDSINPEVLQEHVKPIQLAVLGGQLQVVHAGAVAAEAEDAWVLQILKQFEPAFSVIDAVAQNASRTSLPTLQHVMRSESPTPNLQVFCAAASAGRADIVDWMLSERPRWTTPEAVQYAAGAGHQELAQRLSDYFGAPLAQCQLQPHHLQALANQGQLYKLEWIERRYKLSCDAALLLSGIKSRNLAVVRLLHRHYSDNELTAEMLTEACRTGNLCMVQWVYRHLPASVKPADAIDAAVEFGWEQIVVWLHHNTDLPCTTSAMNSAAILGRLDIVRFLHEQRTEGCTSDAMSIAIREGHLDVADYLRTNRSEGCRPDTLTDAICCDATMASIQWIVTHYPEQLTQDAVNFAARSSRADVIQYFHTFSNAPFSAATMDSAASSGDLDLVRWFHNNRAEGCTAEAIKVAARRGYLSILKFLHEHDYPMCEWDDIEHSPEHIREWWRSCQLLPARDV
ncbi:hypothetical protein RI367_004685 [Sorochytrium milnesiophthora]